MTFPDRSIATAADELYSHQLVAPRLVTANLDETWAERCYHVLHVDSEVMVGLGRAVYPYRGVRTGFASVRAGDVHHTVRHQESFTLGDDADDPQIGPVRIEVVRPMEEIRLVLDAPDTPVALDLTYEARSVAVATTPNVIELDGRVVTNYMNFYQSGYYSGTIAAGGREWRVDRRAGFRDRGWGIRKHEGAPQRGFVLFGSLELPDSVFYVLLYETASGRRAFTNGWLVDGAGVLDTVTAVEHDLILDGRLVAGGKLDLAFDSGSRRELRFEVNNRHFLSAGGYHKNPRPLGYTRWDLTDPAVVEDLNGQNDNGGRCWLDGVEGHGFVETGIGVHARYRPADGT